MNLKEKTVVIDNKAYRYSKIVMLESKEKAKCNELFLYTITNKISKSYYNRDTEHGQHLYFLSTDKICEGDWVLFNNNLYIQKITIDYKDGSYQCECPYTKIKSTQSNNINKIIASTNKSLNLPEPSTSFIQKYIEEYNKGNKITEVMVEYWCGEQTCNCNSRQQDCFRAKNNLIPKVDKNNQITITKVKDSWSREEVIELLLSLNKDKPGNFDCSAWISENL